MEYNSGSADYQAVVEYEPAARQNSGRSKYCGGSCPVCTNCRG